MKRTMPDFLKPAGRKYPPAPSIKNFINFMKCDKDEIYFQPPLLLKRVNIITLSRNDDISEPLALIHKFYFLIWCKLFFISMGAINIVIT
jgi:hypothetical protein